MINFKGFFYFMLCCSILISPYETSPLVKWNSSNVDVQKSTLEKNGDNLGHESHKHTRPEENDAVKCCINDDGKTEIGIESVEDNSTARVIDLNFRSSFLRENTSESPAEMEELTTEIHSNNANKKDDSSMENFQDSRTKLNYSNITENLINVQSVANIIDNGIGHPDIPVSDQSLPTDPPLSQQNYSADGTDKMMNDMAKTMIHSGQPIAAETEPLNSVSNSKALNSSLDVNPHNTSDYEHNAEIKNEGDITDTGLMYHKLEKTNDKNSLKNRNETEKSSDINFKNQTEKSIEIIDVFIESVDSTENSNAVHSFKELTNNRDNTGQAAEGETTSEAELQSVSHNHDSISTEVYLESLGQIKRPQQNESQESTLKAYSQQKVNDSSEEQVRSAPKTNLTSIFQTSKEISKLKNSEHPATFEGQSGSTLRPTSMPQTPESKVEFMELSANSEEQSSNALKAISMSQNSEQNEVENMELPVNTAGETSNHLKTISMSQSSELSKVESTKLPVYTEGETSNPLKIISMSQSSEQSKVEGMKPPVNTEGETSNPLKTISMSQSSEESKVEGMKLPVNTEEETSNALKTIPMFQATEEPPAERQTSINSNILKA